MEEFLTRVSTAFSNLDPEVQVLSIAILVGGILLMLSRRRKPTSLGWPTGGLRGELTARHTVEGLRDITIKGNINHNGMPEFPEFPDTITVVLRHEHPERDDDTDELDHNKRSLSLDDMGKMASMLAVHQAHLKTMSEAEDAEGFINAVIDIRGHCNHFLDSFEA